MKRDVRSFIKAGYVWRYVNAVTLDATGFMAWRRAGVLESLLYRWFKVRPKP